MNLNDEMARQTNAQNAREYHEHMREEVSNLRADRDAWRFDARTLNKELAALQVRNRELVDTIARLKKDLRNAHHGREMEAYELDVLQVQRDRLREAVLSVEWIDWEPTCSEAQCPSCGAFASYDAETNAYDGTHHKGCQLRASLENDVEVE